MSLENLNQLETIVSAEVIQLVQAFVLSIQKELNLELNSTILRSIDASYQMR